MKKLDIKQLSPNMLKTFELCPKKFYFRFIKNIIMPVNDNIFEFGKNIHALASYYLRKENIDRMENSLPKHDYDVWHYLKNSKYFGYEVVQTEYNLAFRDGNYFFGGRLDALVKNDDEYFILDYKTGQAPQCAKYDFQTIIYLMAVSKFFKTNKITFVYLDLKNREEVTIQFSEELKNEYINKLRTIVKKMESIESYSTKTNCTCEYKLICY